MLYVDVYLPVRKFSDIQARIPTFTELAPRKREETETCHFRWKQDHLRKADN